MHLIVDDVINVSIRLSFNVYRADFRRILIINDRFQA